MTYRIGLPDVSPITVEARVYYQAVPPDAIDDLRQYETADVNRFLEMVDSAPPLGVEQVAFQHLVVQP